MHPLWRWRINHIFQRAGNHKTAWRAANLAIATCPTWAAGSSDSLTLFSLSLQPPTTTLGDETRRFEMSASTGDSNLFLRSVMIRRDNLVLSVTYVAGNRAELDRIDTLAALALSRL